MQGPIFVLDVVVFSGYDMDMVGLKKKRPLRCFARALKDRQIMDSRPICILTSLLFMVFIAWMPVCSGYEGDHLQNISSNSLHHQGMAHPPNTTWGVLINGNPQKVNPKTTIKLCKGMERQDSIVFYNNNNGPTCTFFIELAVTEYEQMIGLMFRKTLPRRNGMLFIYNDEDFRYFWMKNTYIPLDMVFIDSNLRVVDIFKNARPLDETTIASKAKAQYVLEINGGQADACKIKKGTRVKINIF